MKALILAAGYGTRLYPLTKEFPKCLLEVGKRPLIDHIVEKIRALKDCNEIIVVTNSKFFPQFKDWASRAARKPRITLVDDLTSTLEDRRGAIGDLYFAITRKRLKDDLLVIGGDNLFEGDLNDFVSFSRTKGFHSCIGVYKLKNKKEASKYGVIMLDKNNRVIDFKEKPKEPLSSLVAMCLYYFPENKLSLVKEYVLGRKQKRDAVGFYIDWLRKKEAMYGFVFQGKWFDIGDFNFYNKARESFKK